MFLYYTVKQDTLSSIQQVGIQPTVKKRVHLRVSLPFAQSSAGPEDVVLVIDREVLHRMDIPQKRKRDGRILVPAVPPDAICNLNPYLPVKSVEAGGGYVVRGKASALQVLLIFRRGVWDLPKGKLEPEETPEMGALREVREEVGIQQLSILYALGSTTHGYAEKGKYRIKTTYWFLMETPEQKFTPQEAEDIEAVAWKKWDEAKDIIGYKTLRRHMEEIKGIGK